MKKLIFKALFPLVSKRFGFRDVELRRDEEGEKFFAKLYADLAPGFETGREFQVHCRKDESFVFSFCIVEP